jgi:hypothetical protein
MPLKSPTKILNRVHTGIKFPAFRFVTLFEERDHE